MDPYAAEAAAFAAAVLDGTPAPVPVTDAIANLRVIEQLFADRAVLTRRHVPSPA